MRSKARVDLPAVDQVDQLGQEPAHRGGAAVQVYAGDVGRAVLQGEFLPLGVPAHRDDSFGALELNCQRLVDPGQAHSLLVYTATPGSESHDKLHLLSVNGVPALS